MGLTATLSGVLSAADGILGRFIKSPTEKDQALQEMERIFQQRDSEVEQTIRKELEAKERIMVAELQQGDTYTKRARPSVVYAGLAMIFINYCAIPIVNQFAGMGHTEPMNLPTEFWASWGTVVSVWSLGRSAEKRGTRNRMTGAITGAS